ncbi:PREDICTED: nucleoporin p58/p45 isoform X2 [Nanorana parkeri]|uniref:nucleoporin p58/p45 isoform X2 n=1 Tax=Nanorana parkeri TaxID=125878 RepID=UPI00085448AF|nr:PREDICTED: nucleoporin p58/p45 isoform X2 [Nanorana parkeri]
MATTGFSFGGSTTTTLNPATGTATPFSFGTNTPASNAGTTPFGGFGTPATTTTPASGTGAMFGAKPATGFALGLQNTPTTTASGFNLNFGKPAGSATPFSLTTTTSSTGLSLPSLTSTPAAGTGFSLNLNTGATAATTASTGLSLGLAGTLFQNATQATTGLGQNPLGLTAPATQTTSNEGLGGIDFSSSSDKKSDKTGRRPEDSKALKDENLPQVICQDVDNFQRFVKEQKHVQEEISRMSSKAMMKVEEDIKALKQLLSLASSGLQRNTLAIDKLKIETAQELKNAEIALRTQKTPPGLQHENTVPSDYFRALVEQFEVQLQQYRQQIEELENHLATQANSLHLTPQDLSSAMQKLYQTFVALAAQLQSIHENVKMLKEKYLGYRKTFLGDSTDVFEARKVEAKVSKWQSAPRITTGPAPFGSVPNAAAVAMAATLTQQQQPATGFGSSSAFGSNTSGTNSFGFGTANKPSGSLSAGFGTSSTSGFNFSSPGITASAGLTFGVSNPSSTNFGTGSQLLQLKKPPVGNKRGKR